MYLLIINLSLVSSIKPVKIYNSGNLGTTRKACHVSHHGCLYYVSLIISRSSEGVISPERHVRTRLYFTSESHVHTMVNILKYGGLFEVSGFYKNCAQQIQLCLHSHAC